MEKLFVLTIFVAITILGCEKQEMYDQLQGNWKIIAISGSIMGFQPIRDFNSVSFNHSKKYFVFFNDTIIQGGSYKIQLQPSEKFQLILHETFNSHPYANFYPEDPFNITFYGNDTLTLSQVYIDGFNYHFIRN